MNRKQVAKVINRKHQDFIKSIKDERVKNLIKENSLITGGSIVSLLLNESVKDYDYYFTNIETVIAVAKYYVNEYIQNNPCSVVPLVIEEDGRIKITIASQGVASTEPIEEESAQVEEDIIIEDEEEQERYRPVFLSENAITLSNKVQLVIRFYGEAEEIHKNYDFVHCTNYWESKNSRVTLNPAAVESILTKQLFYQGSLYPVCSVIRTRKFIQRGWFINAGQFLKMCFQISDLNLHDLDVLREQLTGVDALYFFQVIEYCKERQKEDPNFTINTPYLISIIDKIF